MELKSKKYVDKEDNVWWRLPNGKLHRLDGPAVEWYNGTKAWYVNGKFHRLDGPAVEWSNGDKAWYINDRLHRLDGPAVEHTDGRKRWCINGKRYDNFQSYLKDVKPLITEQEYFILVLTYETEK